VVAIVPTGRTKYKATEWPSSCKYAAVEAEADRPSSGSAMVMMGSTVQSMTQRKDAMLDILRRRSNILDFVLLVVSLLSSSIGTPSLRDEKRQDADTNDFLAL